MTDGANDGPDAGVDPRQLRLKRLRIRCWRRGIKEMDLLLGPFADGPAAALDDAGLSALEALLAENDQDLFAWLNGSRPADPAHLPILAQVAAHHGLKAPKAAPAHG